MESASAKATNADLHRPAAHAWWRPTTAPAGLDGPPAPAGIDPGEEWLEHPLFELFAAVARRQPAAPAVQAGMNWVSYGALHEQAASLAARIDAATEAGAAIATLLPDPVDAACSILACLAAGRPCLSLSPHHPAARLADILADAGAGGLILGPDGTAPAMPYALPLIPVHASDTAATAGMPRPGPPDAPCLVVYTSGSTGRPKGIVRSQRQMLASAALRMQWFRLTPADRMLLLNSLSSGPGLIVCLAALLSGSALHVADVSAIGARRVLDMALEAEITTISGVPVLLRMLFALDGAGEAFASVRGAFTTSESLFRQDIGNWRRILPPGCAIRTGYGLTEGGRLAEWLVPATFDGTGARLPIGYPVPLHDFAITDTAGLPVADDQPGELWVRGRLLSLGEWRHGRCVQGRLLADLDDPSGAILRTGDLVLRRRDGLLEFLGRIDEQIRIRGNRIEPAELEHALRQTSGVSDAAILARRTEGDPVLVAFVVPAGAVEPALRDTVAKRLSAALPSFMLPARLHIVSALPKLPGGKVDPGALQQLDETDGLFAEVVLLLAAVGCGFRFAVRALRRVVIPWHAPVE